MENEFHQNQIDNQEKKQIEFMDQNQLIEYGKKNKFKAKEIEEQNLDEEAKQGIFNEQVYQEILFRYNHEKNIIYFLIYTVKKTQGFIKKKIFEPMHREMFTVSILLLIKVKTLNSKQELNLDQGNNILLLNQKFFSQVKQSLTYDSIKKIFKGDKPNIEGYLQMLVQRSS